MGSIPSLVNLELSGSHNDPRIGKRQPGSEGAGVERRRSVPDRRGPAVRGNLKAPHRLPDWLSPLHSAVDQCSHCSHKI